MMATIRSEADGGRILLVDHEPRLRAALSGELREAGHEVVEAATGAEGLDLARVSKPDLVLLDMLLPDMDFRDVCRCLKEDVGLSGISVFLLSSRELDSERQAPDLEELVDGTILRSASGQELQALVELGLRLRRTEAALLERTRQLDQRVKALECLYSISQLVERPGFSLGETLQGVAELIPAAWQYPEKTCARIVLEDQEFVTSGFRQTDWRQACATSVQDIASGFIEVCYLAEGPEPDEGPFLEEERKLLHAIAERLGRVVERMRTEGALRESEERFRQLAENVEEAFWLGMPAVGPGRQVLYATPAFETLFGIKVEELYRSERAWLELVHPEDRERTLVALEEFLQDRGDYDVEYRIVRPDGAIRWIWAKGFAIRDESGMAFRTAGLAQDITERKLSEQALRQSERELRIKNHINSIFLTHPEEDMYAQVLQFILTLMDSEYGTFGYFDQYGSFIAPALTREIYWEQCNVPEKDIIFQKGTFGGIWGRAVSDRRTLIVNDGDFHTPQGHIPIENTMVTPIVYRGDVISAIHLANKAGGYDERDRALLEAIADQIAPVLYARVQRDRRNQERKRAEEALRQSEERYRHVLESTSDSVYVLDRDWRHVVVNDAASRFVRVPKEILLEQRLTDLFPGIEETPFFQTFQQVMVSREPGMVTAEYVFPDGRRGWYEVHVDPVPEGILCISRDITERMQAGEALRESEYRYRMLFEQILLGITSSGKDGRLTSANPAVLKVLGYSSPDELVGKPAEVLWFDPADRLEALRVASELGYLPLQGVTLRKKDGSPVFALATATIDRDGDGQVSGVTATFVDVTDRKSAEEALRRERNLVSRIAETSPVGIVTFDATGRITYANPLIREMSGLTGDQLLDRAYDGPQWTLESEQGEPLSDDEFPFVRVMRSGDVVHDVRFAARLPDGRRLYLSANAAPLVGESGALEGVVVMVEDITGRRRAEEQVEQAAATAERERLARELHDAVTQTLFSVAAIAEALPRVWARDPEEGQRGLEELRWLSQGALAEMRTMLLELRPAALTEQKLGVLLQQLAEAMSGRTRMPITVQVVGDRFLPSEVQMALYRIAQEALNNVTKHARARSTAVSLNCSEDWVELQVKDDGRGFEPGALETTGLGLEIMHERAHSVGATLRIESQPGLGTEVVVDWPTERGEEG
jgi:PAS domain S-box-containing protein